MDSKEKSHRGDSLTKTESDVEPKAIGVVDDRSNMKYGPVRQMLYIDNKPNESTSKKT